MKRTHLALECVEMLENNKNISGIKTNIIQKGNAKVSRVEILSDDAAKKLEKEKGIYITVETDKIASLDDDDFENAVDLLKEQIISLFDIKEKDTVLIAGLGNKMITADSLGPKSIEKIIVTRPLKKAFPEMIKKNHLRNVCAICTDVFGNTGVESFDIISGIAKKTEAKLVIVIDALATTNINRLCKTIQISNAPITPGGGVLNDRKEISFNDLDIGLISIGVPTVIDAKTFLDDSKTEILSPYENELVCSPIQIDSMINNASKLVAFAINKALHYEMKTDDIIKFLS